jgi:transcriptional regulator GlxA family with amidase domain
MEPRKVVAILVFDGMEILDFAGPAEVFAAAGDGRAFDVVTVGATRDDITSQGFVTIRPGKPLADVGRADVLVVPGGSTRQLVEDPRVVAWTRTTAAGADVTLSVCTGAFLLAKAGLLDGREATTHWGSIDALRSAAPRTKVHADRRFVDTGAVVTAAGVSAGIDAALHVVARLLGRPAALDTARYMEYRWTEPPPAN